jgi:hypothetical protein
MGALPPNVIALVADLETGATVGMVMADPTKAGVLGRVTVGYDAETRGPIAMVQVMTADHGLVEGRMVAILPIFLVDGPGQEPPPAPETAPGAAE